MMYLQSGFTNSKPIVKIFGSFSNDQLALKRETCFHGYVSHELIKKQYFKKKKLIKKQRCALLRLQLGWPIPNSLSDKEAPDRAGAIEKHPFERGTGPPAILRVGRRWMRFDRGTVVPLAHQPIAPREEDPTLSACSTARIAVRRPRYRAGRPASQRGNLAQHRRPRASISSSSTTLRAPQPLTLPLRRPRAPHPPTAARPGRVLLLVGLTSFCGGDAHPQPRQRGGYGQGRVLLLVGLRGGRRHRGGLLGCCRRGRRGSCAAAAPSGPLLHVSSGIASEHVFWRRARGAS
jgi:hypothetical protein